MPGGDFLQELLRSSLEQSPSGEAPGFLGSDPTTGAADRASSLEAIKHYMVTGQPPAEVQSPSYGPIGGILQKIGLRSQFRPVNPGLREDMTLAGQIKAGQDEQTKMDKIQQIQQGSAEFGSDYGKRIAGIEGVPDVGAALPTGMKGMGELRATDRELKMQQMLNSTDLKERELGIREQSALARDYISQGRLDDANRVVQMGQERIQMQQEKEQNAPINQLIQDTMGDLRAKENHLMSIQASLIDPDSPQAAKIDQQIQAVEAQRRKLLSRREKIKTGADLDSILYGNDAEPSAPKPSGTTHYRPLPAVD